MKTLALLLTIAFALGAQAASAQEPQGPHEDPGQLPYATPRETLIPGTPSMPGGFHLMLNGFAEAMNPGLGSHRISNVGVKSFNGGATYPLLVDDWSSGNRAKGCGMRSTRIS
jgi:hypothetical protein